MASIAVNDGLRYAAKKLTDHDGLVFLRNRVECFLDNMAAERVHGEVESVATNSLCDLDDLVGKAMLETALDKEVTKAVNHEGVGLGNDGLNYVVLLLLSSNLELLLQEDGRLLVIVADNLVDDILPVAGDVPIEKAPVVQRLS